MILSPSRRVRKAYWTAFVVYFSYFWLSLRRRFMGRKWYESRIVALHIQNAERVKTAILELEGLFIKVGQLLSVMSNFLPEEFQKPLEALQDRLPARPFGEVRKRIEEELGKSPEAVFQQIEEIPMATASIGQAHRAVLPDGTEVVVKVQHYGIETIASVDLRILHRLTKIYAWLVDIKGMEHLYSQIRQMIEEEMDFTNEARTMERIRQNLVEETEVQIPQLFDEYSTRRVMVTRFCTGAKISDLEQLDTWGVDRRALAARLLRVWCRMVFKDGFYHADPHPGNILVSPNGNITLLDFGATANLSPQLRKGITQLIESAVKNDTEGMIEACRTMGFLAEGQDAERMAKKMIGALRNFLQNEIQFEGLDFRNIKVNPFNNSLTDLITEIGFRGIAGTVQMPKDYVLLNRTITLLLGICNTLAPAYNPLETVRPYAQKYLMQDKGGPLNYVRELLQSTLTSVLALPDEVQKTLKKVRAGEVEIRTPDLEEAGKQITRGIKKLILALLAIGLGFFSLRMWEMGWYEESRWGFWGAGALVIWVIGGRK
ncbi:MAG: AarF/ABC1/UbiB kinase family protein [Chitinophagales bacterium]|nr:AarF/ABC1/UbiB kinase family protein [Chitinophagales bacterium]